MSLKVLVTGSREFTDYNLVYETLDALWLTKPATGMIVIHGNARGADKIADIWAVARKDVSVVRVPADWENDANGAGPIRNRRMLELGPDLVVAFLKKSAKNVGTKNMIGFAEHAGVPVYKHYEE